MRLFSVSIVKVAGISGIGLACLAAAVAGPTVREPDYPAALARAKETGNDLVVLQRGSDWNTFGETLYREVWSRPEFVAALGDGFVLTTVDRPEQPGAPALGSGGDDPSVKRFLDQVGKPAPTGPDDITSLKATGGAAFKRRPDGTWLVDDPKGAHNPAQDTIEFTLESRRGGSLLRLDFLPDPSLPNGGAGRATNGNFAISEIIVTRDGKPFQPTAAWASATEGNMPAAMAIDGISDQPNNAWNAAAHTRQPRCVMLALPEPLRPSGSLRVRIVCQSQWGQHVPACLRAILLDDAPAAAGLARVTAAQDLATRNNAFNWWDGGRCPRVALLDAEGRAIGAEDNPKADPAQLASRIRALRDTRAARDELLAKAATQKGPEQAETLRQALAVLGFRNWGGNGDCYKPIHQKIKDADPQDASGATRWLGFGADPKSGVPWAKPAWNEALDTQGGKRTLTDADYQEALARVDKELADSRNAILDHENIQRMMVAKFHICRSWKGHEEQRFAIQREIAALDPDTFWGIGARGYLGMYGKSDTPFLTYGWKPGQLKAGANVWRITDTAYFFDHPGRYQITLAHAGGADKVRVKRLALLDGDQVLAEAAPAADLGPGPLAKVEAVFDCAGWQTGKSYVFLAELDAAEGHLDQSGLFQIEPLLVEPAATAAGETDYYQIQRSLRDKLTPVLSANAGKPAAAAETGDVRHDLARYEFLRRCGPDTVTQLATRHGGAAFLKEFMGDVDWLESFLINDEAPWPQALENLRLLHANGRHLEVPLYRRLATAMAMAAGTMNRYRLLDRYHDIIRVHREGRLHPSFDRLDTREMRWAVLLSGTAADFQWMVDVTQVRLTEYLGTCHQIPYIDPNAYGYSVQGWGYTDPWTHQWGTGTGDRPFHVQRTVGGVCGTLSGFGSATSKAHGVMATTVGQPGHCAYVVRVGLEWPTGNDVFGPETNGASVFEGTGFPTMNRLYEPMHAAKAAYAKSTRLAWAAHVLLDRQRVGVRVRPGLKYSVYQLPGGNLAALPNLKPVTTGTAAGFDLAAVLPADTNNFGVVWEGQIEIDSDGPLQVQLRSDDGSSLKLGTQTIACNQAPATVTLGKGIHPVRLEYAQGGGAYSLQVDWLGSPVWRPDWSGAYRQAIAAHPLNYPLWLECLKAFESATGTPPETWAKLMPNIATAFAPYHEAGWALANRCLAKAAPAMSPPERMALLLKCHDQLRQANSPLFMGYNLAGVLNTQADALGDPVLAVEFMKKLLAAHFSKDASRNRVFGMVMNWGRDRFGANPATAAAYAKAVGAFFTSLGDAADPNEMRNQITAGIRKASEAGDAAAYQLWAAMAAKLLPPVQPGEIHLNADQAGNPPKAQPFPGTLLSKTGMLQTSSACQYDRPLSYAAVLDGQAPGYFDTNNEPKPWAQVALAGDAEISGIVLVNRYELPANNEEFGWAAPLKVLASTDGKTWTEVALCPTPELVMRVDLAGKVQRARFIRIERQPPADGKAPGRLHFRNFLVYGRKLY